MSVKRLMSLAVAVLSTVALSFAAVADSYWQGTTGGDLTAGDNWDALPAAGVKAKNLNGPLILLR